LCTAKALRARGGRRTGAICRPYAWMRSIVSSKSCGPDALSVSPARLRKRWPSAAMHNAAACAATDPDVQRRGPQHASCDAGDGEGMETMD
jgi:hypothetical protein